MTHPKTYPLLDRRYRVTTLLRDVPGERWYAGVHVELATPVRIIAMASDVDTNGPAVAARFWNLAATATSLRHATLPRVRDCFRQGGTWYVVTDEILAETVTERVARAGTLTTRETLALGLQLCDALAYLEQAAPLLAPLGALGPDMVGFSERGRALIADLGFRHWLMPTPEHSHTRDAHGRCVGHSDICGIAETLYVGLTGRALPPMDLGRLPLSMLAPEVPPSLVEAIERALAPAATSPFADAHMFGEALALTAYDTVPQLAAVRAPRSGVTAPRPQRERISARPGQTARQPVAAPRTDTSVGLDSLVRRAPVSTRRVDQSALRRTGARARAALSTALHRAS